MKILAKIERGHTAFYRRYALNSFELYNYYLSDLSATPKIAIIKPITGNYTTAAFKYSGKVMFKIMCNIPSPSSGTIYKGRVNIAVTTSSGTSNSLQIEMANTYYTTQQGYIPIDVVAGDTCTVELSYSNTTFSDVVYTTVYLCGALLPQPTDYSILS